MYHRNKYERQRVRARAVYGVADKKKENGRRGKAAERQPFEVFMGREIKYKAKELEEKVTEYFDSISIWKPATERYATGELTNKGKPVYAEREIRNVRGETVMVLSYIVPPSVEALCIFLGISYKTWENYAKRKGYDAVCESAKLRIKAYLMKESIIRDNPQGILFQLEANYGMTRKSEVRQEIAVGGVEEFLQKFGGEQSF